MIARRWVWYAGAAAVFLLLGWTSHHHWDEFFYLYSSATFTPRQLMGMDGTMMLFPHGYFAGKLGHVALLRLLMGWTGEGTTALVELQVACALMLLLAVAAARGLLGELVDAGLARRASLVLLLLPLTLYLAYKPLSEVPSFLLATLACWAFLVAFRSAHARQTAACLVAAALALGGAMLCRVTSPLAFVGLALGLLGGREPRFPPRLVVVRAALVTAAAVLVHAVVLHAFGGSEWRLIQLASHVVSIARGFARVSAGVFFVQAFALVLPFALLRPWTPAVRTGLVWLIVTVLPNLSGHEPRYYTPALLPLALLCAIGLERIVRWRIPEPRPWHWGGALALLVLFDHIALMPLMPYELDQRDLDGIVRSPAVANSGTVIVPWASDYAFLRFTHPQLAVELAMSALPGSRYDSPVQGPISEADQGWAGATHYVGTPAALAAEPRPWVYVGWTYNPVMLKVRRITGRLGLQVLADPAKTGWHDHLTGSWIWSDTALTKREVARQGQYVVFELLPFTHP